MDTKGELGGGEKEELGGWDWCLNAAETVYQIDNWWEPAVQPRQLCSVLCGHLMGRKPQKEGICICVWLTHFAVQQETQYCQATVLQWKSIVKKKKAAGSALRRGLCTVVTGVWLGQPGPSVGLCPKHRCPRLHTQALPAGGTTVPTPPTWLRPREAPGAATGLTWRHTWPQHKPARRTGRSSLYKGVQSKLQNSACWSKLTPKCKAQGLPHSRLEVCKAQIGQKWTRPLQG